MITMSGTPGAAYYLKPGSGCCARVERSPAGYQMDGVESGEPPGRWAWRGENALGLEGSIVPGQESAEEFRLVVDETRDPTRPKGKDGRHPHLGRAPMNFRTVGELVEAFQRKHPDATPEALAAYRAKASADPRTAKTAHDITHSAPKSWSVLYAALMWAGRRNEAETLWECFEAGVDAAMTHMHENLLFIQNRPTGPEVGGRRTARYERARNMQYATFRHHTSREGDPQLHIHALVVNRALDSRGRWRALYSPAFYKAQHEMGMVLMRTAEAEATRRLGLSFIPSADGASREIEGVSVEARVFFSSRTRALTEEAQQLIDAFTALYDREPTKREKWRMLERANKATRKPKPKSPPSAEEQLEAWEERVREETRESFADVLEGVDEARHEPGAVGTPAVYEPEVVIERAVADLERRHSVWNWSQLLDAINRALPAMLEVDRPERVVAELAERAARTSRLRPVEVAPAVRTPESLRDPKRDQEVFDAPNGRRFTSDRVLALEGSLVARLDQRTASWAPTDRVAQLLEASGLSAEQDAAVAGMVTSGRWLEVVDAAAGTGKTTMTRELSRVCTEHFGTGVVGFTVAERPAQVLRGQVAAAHNIKQYLVYLERETAGEVSDVERARFGITPGQYCVIDEASTVDTWMLTELVDALYRRGAGKVILVGDRQQADPVDAGGAFGMLVDELEHRRREAAREQKALPPSQRDAQDAVMAQWTTPPEREQGPVYRLRQVRRFDQQWERDASAQVREGDVTAVHQYDTRGRVHGDTDREKNRDAAVAGFVDDWLAGLDSIIVTATTEQASEAADFVRRRLVDAGHVERGGVRLRDETKAGLGDLIQTRENDRTVGALNRQRWQVIGRGDDGSLEVREQLEDGSHGPARTLPGDYVRSQVELAYAGTVHAVEGVTVRGSSHTLLSRSMGSAHAYVGTTRATGENHVYCELEDGETPLERFAAVVSRDGHAAAATSTIAIEQDRATNLGHIGPAWEYLVRETRAATHRQMLRDALGVEADGVLQDRAVTRLFGLIRGAELSGHEPDELLAACAGKGSLSGSRSPASVLYARVADEMATGPKPRPVPVGFEARTPRPSRGDVENERLAHARELGKVMDRRAAHLAELAAVDQPAWAVRALGPVPADPDARARWVGDVALAAAYRERYGIDDDTTAVGRKPAHAEPERGWLWDMAAQRIGMPEHERNLAGLSDGDLANRVQAWERELAWAPRNVDEDLRGAHEALREARTQEVNARVAGREDADAAADVWAMTELVEKLEYVAQVRARWHDHTTDAREAAEEARAEQRRRREVEQARGGLHPDDPGVEVEPDWDGEYDDVEPEHEPVEAEPVDPREAAADAVMARVAATWTPERPAVFGSRDWSLLADDAPEKRAAVVAAAARLYNFGQPLDEDRADVDRRLNVRDVEEPTEWLDVETTARTQFWAEDHGLHVEAPRFGSPKWVALDDDDPRKGAAEVEAATRWWNFGDDLDSRRARADKADEEAREAAEAREVVDGPHVEALDQRAAELERDAEPGGFQRPQVEPEPEPEVVEDEQVDRSRYAWVREAAERHEEQRRVVVEEEVPAPREAEVVEDEPADVEPVPDPGAERAAKDAQLREDLDRAKAAADRMERDEAAARERDVDEQRQRDDDRARDMERDEQDRERVDY